MSKTAKHTRSKSAVRKPQAQRTASTNRKQAQSQPTKSANVPMAPTGKIATVVALLRRPKGASIADMCKSTGWQAHSVRGALSGAIKKKLGLKVASEKTNGLRTYRIAN